MKFLRLLARARYWKSRALKAETRLIVVSAEAEAELQKLRHQAEAEKYRNMSREDAFASAAAFQSHGIMGLFPRNGPAGQMEVPRLVRSTDPWQDLSPMERMEYDMEYLPDALRNGVSPQKAKNDFLADIASRKQHPFRDEPLN